MKAMIFAAGLGTRLSPLTNDRPKALVEINGTPMLGLLIHKLAKIGITQFIVNVHHYADMVIDYLKSQEFNSYDIIISDERDLLLETGGGLLKARNLLLDDGPVLVHNVDIWTDFNFEDFINNHVSLGAFASVAVSHRDTSRYLLFNDKLQLIGWENLKTGESRMQRDDIVKYQLAFSGIHLLSQEFLQKMHGDGKFSIIDTYLEFSKSNDIIAWEHPSEMWMDLGKPEAIYALEKKLL
jgi:NDP-sugar pyrophosphorylase family protein